MGEVIKTSWHNNTIQIGLSEGDDIPAKIKEVLASLITKINGKAQVSLRLDKYMSFDVTNHEDLIDKVTREFEGMTSPSNMTMTLDFNVITDIDPTKITAAEFKNLLLDKECKQIIGKVEVTAQSSEK